MCWPNSSERDYVTTKAEHQVLKFNSSRYRCKRGSFRRSSGRHLNADFIPSRPTLGTSQTHIGEQLNQFGCIAGACERKVSKLVFGSTCSDRPGFGPGQKASR